MTLLQELPDQVVHLLQSSLHSEFATVSSAGVPIDTPMLFFPSEGLRTFDVATGLAYPSKAERARRNPKVGLLIEGALEEPVISIAGLAAVKDADLQANAERYIAETGFARVGSEPWAKAHKAVWYWTRIIVSITPVRIAWWQNRAALDAPPQQWRAPADMVYPKSDPAPAGIVSAPLKLAERPWREQAQDALARRLPGHLTLCDDDGFPLPIRARHAQLTEEGFALDIPKAAPWSPSGTATLTFAGISTFVGSARAEGPLIHLRVERALPVHPFMADVSDHWEASSPVCQALMRRLNHEVARRGQPIPTIPELEPEPSAGAKLRMARLASRARKGNVE